MASQSKCFLDLPLEVIRIVLGYVDFTTACNLRMISHEMSDFVALGSLSEKFQKRTVKLLKQDLELFVKITSNGRLVRFADQLTIAGIMFDEDHGQADDSNEITRLLSQAFSNIARTRSFQPRQTLSLTVQCLKWNEADKKYIYPALVVPPYFSYVVRDWESIWQCAGETARIIAVATRQSKLHFDELDIYGSISRMAVSNSRLKLMLPYLQDHRLKKLSLTLSADETDLSRRCTPIAESLSRLLIVSKQLNDLTLRWFKVHRGSLPERELQDRQFFDAVAKLKLPLLTSLSLRGLMTSENALQTFLSNHKQLDKLTLEHVSLTQGSFRAIFYIIEEDLTLDGLYLNDLFESALLQFDYDGEPHFPTTNKQRPTWMRMDANDQRQAIDYNVMKGRALGSVQHRRWWRRNRQLYGPADSPW
ncbi:hypothetical protein MRB53_040584 [Persea americana]|nr:hypothetical protein MRB53_040584 [Persea americana]